MSALSIGHHRIRTIYDLLDVIRVHPGMWIGVLSLARLQGFLAGFCTGIGAAYASLDNEVPPFRGFDQWVAYRLGCPTNDQGWAVMLVHMCGSEEVAFERFWMELDAYRRGAV